MRVALFSPLIVAVFAVAAGAEDPPDPMQHARDAYAAWQKVKATARPPEPPPGASEAMRNLWKTGPTAATVNESVFGDRFSMTDLTAWDAEKEPDLVREGLRLTAQEAYLDGRAAKSVQAADLFIARYPKHDATPGIRGFDLPSALIMNDQYERAAVVARAHAAALTGILGARASILLGDLETLYENADAARAAYERAFDQTKDPGTIDFDVNKGDWEEFGRKVDNKVARELIELRKKTIGTKFSKLKLIANIGPAYTVLKKGAGNLVLWISQALESDTLVALDKLSLSDGSPARVVAVTWQDDGYFSKQKVTRSRYRLDLAAFRKTHALSMPFAILLEKRGMALVGESRKGMLLVVDREGRVTFASRPPDFDPRRLPVSLRLIRAFVRRTPAATEK